MAIVNNDFHEILTGRHSVRRFDPSVKISRDEMKEMLVETITAPSACNLQAWKFVVVDTDEGREVTRNWNFDILDGCSIIAEESEFDDARDAFLTSLNVAEHCYLELLQKGWTPQKARSVLPLGIKSELISCGFEDSWENFFKRRDAPDAHPMAQEIAKPMHEEFLKLTKV